MMRAMARLLAVVLSLALGAGALQAQTTVPPGMTQQQFDAMVDAISKSVAEKLKADAPKPKSGKDAPKAEIVRTPLKEGPGEVAIFLQRAGAVALALPVLGHQFKFIAGKLDQAAHGGWGLVGFVLMLGLVAVAAVLAESAVRRLFARLRTHLAALALTDAVGLGAVWLICNGAGALFASGTVQDKVAEAVLIGIFDWRLILAVFRFVLQPETPAARLVEVESAEARLLQSRIASVVLLVIVGRILWRILVASGTPADAIAAYQVGIVLVYVPVSLWLVLSARTAAQQWLASLGTSAPLARVAGRRWIGVAGTFFVALGATQIYSAISGRMQVGSAMLLTLTVVIGLLIFDTLMQAVVRRLDARMAERAPGGVAPKLPDVVARCVRVAVLIGAFVTVAETWVVDVLGLASADQWDQITRSSRTAGVTLFVAFVAWELFKYATAPYMARKAANPADAAMEGDAQATPASRLSTMMPLLRMAAGILIGFLAIVLTLEDFGINVMPLIAGASIFGIAISFGSQTLVRDIVSGIFYLTDDAFRVGEYIDCGRAKGTVEGFTLRSIRLRHQNGQVHTIPFGQLGQITNFSRDWLTVKFNLRFALDTDIEKLRKAAKKIGAEMMEVPEIKAEILAPFKMQGVADITDGGLLVRFKFTARPGNPALIQREAVKRMFRTLPGMGIQFAKDGATVIVQTPHMGSDTAGPAVEPAGAPAATPIAA
jgi:small-conductance mechanosensitive channel